MILVEEDEMTVNPDTDTIRSQTLEAEANQAEIGKETTDQVEEIGKETAEDTKMTTEGKHEIRFTSFARLRQIN